MKLKELCWLGARTITGILSMVVTMHAAYSALGVDFRFNSIVSILYCVLPGLSFFVFLFAKPARLEIALHAAIAIGFLIVSTALAWRACAELGYCSTVGSTTLEVAKAMPMMAAFGVAVFSAISMLVDAKRR